MWNMQIKHFFIFQSSPRFVDFGGSGVLKITFFLSASLKSLTLLWGKQKLKPTPMGSVKWLCTGTEPCLCTPRSQLCSLRTAGRPQRQRLLRLTCVLGRDDGGEARGLRGARLDQRSLRAADAGRPQRLDARHLRPRGGPAGGDCQQPAQLCPQTAPAIHLCAQQPPLGRAGWQQLLEDPSHGKRELSTQVRGRAGKLSILSTTESNNLPQSPWSRPGHYLAEPSSPFQCTKTIMIKQQKLKSH